MNKIIKLFLLWAVVMMALPANAQRRISGTVSDDIDVVIGANVKEVDKNNRILNAVETDFNGNFTMTLKDDKSNLVISYMGYQTITIPTAGKTVFKVTLKDNSTTMKELKVEGKKLSPVGGLEIPEREFSGSVQKFDMADLDGLSFASVDEALQGQIAGLDIVANSGNAGAGTTMKLRGTSSLNGNTQPLIVVNDHIFEVPEESKGNIDYANLDNEEQFSTLLNVNPEDIESITVLKDGSAAKWGDRAAGGVIEIKTKRGKRGPTSVTFSYKFSGKWQPAGYKMLNGDEYTMYLKEAYYNATNTSKSILELDYNNTYGSIFHNFNKNTDWVNAVQRFSKTHNYYLTLSGGGEKATFRIGAGYDMDNGTAINQHFSRFSTSTALDYWVSDRIKFSSNINMTFATRYNNSVANTANGNAYSAMPNMTIYAYDRNGNPVYNENGDREYFYMLPLSTNASFNGGSANDGEHTSYELRDMYGIGNPVAFANLSESKQNQYTLAPQFNIVYKLLGKSDDEWRLDYNGDVYLSISNNSDNTFTPSKLVNMPWEYGGSNSMNGYNNNRNKVTNSENKAMSFTTRHELRFYSGFKNTKHKLSGNAMFEMNTGTYSSQSISKWNLPDGVEDATSPGMLYSAAASTGETRGHSFFFQTHYSYDSKYSLTGSVRIDGNPNFGRDNKYSIAPYIGGRWNVSDEKWMEFSKDWLSMFGLSASYGITPNAQIGTGNQYNRYGNRGTYLGHTVIVPENLSLHSIRREIVTNWNFGANLAFFDNMLTARFDVYGRKSTDQLISGINIPSANGFNQLAYTNGGIMSNKGWELFLETGKFAKVGKFSMKGRLNFSQTYNKVIELNSLYLENANGPENLQPSNLSYKGRLQLGNSVASIYGLKYKGIYRYDYEHNGHTLNSWSDYGYNETIIVDGQERTAKDYNEFLQYQHTATGKDLKGNPINTAAAAQRRGEDASCPIAYDKNGNMLTDAKGNPLPMYFCYTNDGGTRYKFDGGDVMYEDINSDGQIDRYDLVYLGNSNPTFYGGGGLQLFYDKLSLNIGFNFRVGAQVVNVKRQELEQMSSNINQSYATTWRWRKNGDITEIPRAISTYGTGAVSYNSLPNDRFVENADYFTLNYIQLNYSIDPKNYEWLKTCGVKRLNFYASINNLFTWSKYSGLGPEVSGGSWTPALDYAKVPKPISFTCSVNLGF